MDSFRNNLPPLDALIFFQAAARCGSFSAAAREMRVTQAAVSKRVQRLEEWLGTCVFERKGRSITLTEGGQAFANDVHLALEFLERAVSRFKAEEEGLIRVASTSSMSVFWLQDRLKGFALSEAASPVNVTTSDDMNALTAPELDLTIVYSDGPAPGWSGVQVMAGELAPAAAPDVAAKAVEAGAFGDHWQPGSCPPLLEYANLTPDWINWSIWLRRLGLPALAEWPVMPCSSFGQSVGRAMSGRGILLANLDMLRSEFAAGHLIRIGSRTLSPRKSYYLCHRADKPLSSAARRLFDFLISAADQ
ncbi:hypothetical protein RA19_18490 [Leisingera sp. ANG-M1]|uniref:LysR family transcriptional regulator n=1 Tax=Leisingera sp. ANG-M1 TaxID=1577895 RepID=UPI00057DD780|nr:LysR family transcriptional regulator [Leisingera sp. ANG-M1]KIC08847.1 hypothetical protein RA19_18490 [Leisingera sp. ANG-M1]